MLVKQLIKELQKLNPDARVILDIHGRTELVEYGGVEVIGDLAYIRTMRNPR
jgi:hypothetical protein